VVIGDGVGGGVVMPPLGSGVLIVVQDVPNNVSAEVVVIGTVTVTGKNVVCTLPGEVMTVVDVCGMQVGVRLPTGVGVHGITVVEVVTVGGSVVTDALEVVLKDWVVIGTTFVAVGKVLQETDIVLQKVKSGPRGRERERVRKK